MQRLNANIDAYNRWVKVHNDFDDTWTMYATSVGNDRKVDSLNKCLSIVRSLDTTTGSEYDLGMYAPIRRWKAARIGQVNAYLGTLETFGADWSVVKQWDEEVRQSDTAVQAAIDQIEKQKNQR